MKSPIEYAAKARMLESTQLFTAAAVLFRMAANASTRKGNHGKACMYRGDARRCEARRSAAA